MTPRLRTPTAVALSAAGGALLTFYAHLLAVVWVSPLTWQGTAYGLLTPAVAGLRAFLADPTSAAVTVSDPAFIVGAIGGASIALLASIERSRSRPERGTA